MTVEKDEILNDDGRAQLKRTKLV